MHYEEKTLTVTGSLADSRLQIYIRDYSTSMTWENRPLVLICPGGGYRYTSDREAEPIALSFMAMGYNAAVLRYSCEPATYPTALLELCQAILYIRKNAHTWHVDANKIYVAGFSAGAHLAASLGVFWKTDLSLSGYFNVDAESIRPNALILSYPVITSGEFAHRGSFDILARNDKALLEKLSLENQVNKYVPATFIWHTFEDQTVPLENSLLFAKALKENNIRFEYHVFPSGRHGLSLSNKTTSSDDSAEIMPGCEIWIDLCQTFLKSID